MQYNFDQIIDRKNTNSIKYDFAIERGLPDDVLPLWVADMDFPVLAEIKNSLHEYVDHGIFGYSEVKSDYFEVIHHWFQTHFQWDTKEEWLVKTPGVVFAIALAIKAFTKEGDSILIQPPVYYPFSATIRQNSRTLIENHLVYENHEYYIDFKDFEDKIIQNDVKLFIFCNPANPVGRVWSRNELEKLGTICVKHNVLIVSDEIHCDFTYPGFQHIVFASLCKQFSKQTITCTAPSKTFNLAGLQVSNIFIEEPTIRKKFIHELMKSGYSQLNTLGLVASKAAYEYGEPWLFALKQYLFENLEFVRAYLKTHLPMIHLIEPQGTYLVWLDLSNLHLSKEDQYDLIVHKSKLWLDNGSMFQEGADHFERINIACPRQVLRDAFEQLRVAVSSLPAINK